MTVSYQQLARHVIHTVGPIWNGGRAGEDNLLHNCYCNSMALAAVADERFPAISTGVYRFPVSRAT